MNMEWDNNTSNQGHQQQQDQIRDDVKINGGGGGAINVMYAKVMSDEQLETLRKQIAVYATICDQLVQMHKTITAQQDLAAGGRLGNIYSDSFVGQKFTSRQRWTPTAAQLQNLERIFEQGSGTPSKQKIKEITSELSQHGQISETNVYNWFQNRRARSKRKQVVNNSESEEVETEVDEKNITKPEMFLPQGDDLYFHGSEITSDMHYLDALSNQNEPLPGKIGVPESYNLYNQADDYGMAG